jgi:protease-4
VKKGWWVVIGVSAGFWLLILLILGLIAAAATGHLGGGSGRWDEERLEGHGPRKIAVVNIEGEIHGGENAASLFAAGGAGAADVTSQIRQALDDRSVSGVILRIDSPGGAVVASSDIARAVRRLRARKPVVASKGDLAASGGYFVASQATRIVADPGTLTGSIGVIAILPNLSGTAEKLGIKPVVLKAGALKDLGSPFRDMTPKERALYQRLLDESRDEFVKAVATGRGMALSTVDKLADGRPYSGLQAKANGLVDQFGDLETAYTTTLRLANRRRSNTTLVEYRAHKGLAGLLPFGARSAVDELKTELGVGLGLQYLYLP